MVEAPWGATLITSGAMGRERGQALCCIAPKCVGRGAFDISFQPFQCTGNVQPIQHPRIARKSVWPYLLKTPRLWQGCPAKMTGRRSSARMSLNHVTLDD